MKIKLGGAVAAAVAVGALGLAGPALAQDDPAFAHGVPEVTMAPGDECGEVELTFINPTPWLFVWDVRVDGEAAVHGSVAPGLEIAEGPLAGQEFGDRWTLVQVNGAEVESVTETFSFTDSVEVRLAEGAEQKLYHDWLSFDVDALECPEPTPTPTATADPQPTVGPTVGPTAVPSETPAPGVGGEQLPTTGVPAAGIAAGGAGLVAAGLVATWLFRRRRVSFQA